MLLVLGLMVWAWRDAKHDAESAMADLESSSTAPQTAPLLADTESTHQAAHSEAASSQTSGETPSAHSMAPDLEQITALNEELSVVEDRTTSMHPIEMPAYYRLLSWVRSQSAAALLDGAKQETFHNLVHRPAESRGRLLKVDLRIRRVLRYSLPAGNPLGSQDVYEMWGWPTNSRGWLYVVLTTQLPPGLSVRDETDVPVTAVGYFFKLQGYQPAEAKPSARPLVAPLLIGRVVVQHPTVLTAAKDQTWLYWILGVGMVVLTVTFVSSFLTLRRTSWRRSRSPSPSDARPFDGELLVDSLADDALRGEPAVDKVPDDEKDEYWWMSSGDRPAPPYADR